MVYRRSQYVMVRGGLSKFQEVCKVSSKFDVASLQVWPRMVYRRSQYVMVRRSIKVSRSLMSLRSKYGRDWSQIGKDCISHRGVTKALPKHDIDNHHPEYGVAAWGCAKFRMNYFLSYILRRRNTPKNCPFLPPKN
ncbi:hypothetical protein OtV5_001c [Ostreococcus tauri virus OtV5]|uniref:Uncharacterized protein n=1 Tax=Ostreococcus tauri virus OtV5 TaxID=1785753 RepID=A9YWG4_9PHYC|nr:hypothetical protein OtV5_247 [Ostreococcus tauri virus OtV5]YP_009227161.1 hypothetical protein OtV5_001c [Ostreococcus tauri virus OtV5]ABY28047.2 hypothetical protein OtV5_247 [Ostreococcus tauri virus OtV5]AMA76488.1 hypothetical protein OtV5_001c [Ostreococcus tauri virus OtV5]